MFGLFERNVIDRMEEAFQKAMLCVHLALKSKGFIVGNKQLDDDGNALWAAAVANYLFGQGFNDVHLKKINSNHISLVGLHLLEGNQNLKELVVQSLRVMSVLKHSDSSNDWALHDNHVLELYGHEFAEASDPSSYESLAAETWEVLKNDVEIVNIDLMLQNLESIYGKPKT